MSAIDPETTKFKFSAAQLCMLIGALVSCTVWVQTTLFDIKNETKQLRSDLSGTWTKDDMNRWVWLANSKNPKVSFPYPVEIPPSP